MGFVPSEFWNIGNFKELFTNPIIDAWAVKFKFKLVLLAVADILEVK